MANPFTDEGVIKLAEVNPARRRFTRLLGSPGALDLTELAFAIAEEERGAVDLSASRDQLAALVAGLKRQLQSANPGSAAEQSRLLCRFLAGDQSFLGNQDDYYEVDNSCLDQVLQRRQGIPISLALVYLHVGNGAGLNVRGVNFPGHFLVAVDCDQERALIDPFSGQPLSESQLQQLLQQQTGDQQSLLASLHRSCTVGEILQRMLNNLRGIYLQRGEAERVLACCDRILLIDPDNSREIFQRITVYEQLNRQAEALAELIRLRGLLDETPFRHEVERRILDLDTGAAPLQ
ncbi:MAG TPA: hypothetical protein DCF45_13445 [Gammaproteobacteria bacterium]|nr:hypothetical protein [Gammaproteobacteria bacterium]